MYKTILSGSSVTCSYRAHKQHKNPPFLPSFLSTWKQWSLSSFPLFLPPSPLFSHPQLLSTLWCLTILAAVKKKWRILCKSAGEIGRTEHRKMSGQHIIICPPYVIIVNTHTTLLSETSCREQMRAKRCTDGSNEPGEGRTGGRECERCERWKPKRESAKKKGEVTY